jgi:glycosyltransferase involved in cell wall biosynthesis
MLPRVLESLKKQSYTDFHWIIVNDGGSRGYVDDVLTQASASGIHTEVIHNSSSKGMEAASNIGVMASSTEFLIIHDDDDSWSEGFLQKTISFLLTNDYYQGVVTQSNKIVEKVGSGEVEFLSSEMLNPFLESVELSLMAMRNQFPPISFVFRRRIYDLVGGFDEGLPVLGDWDFNLRVLMQGDVGVIPEPLANHHHRYEISAGDESYGNTVTVGIKKHLEWEARYRNKHIRKDLHNNCIGFGHLLSQGKQNQLLYSELEQLKVTGDAWRSIIRFNEKYGLGFFKNLFRRQ